MASWDRVIHDFLSDKRSKQTYVNEIKRLRGAIGEEVNPEDLKEEHFEQYKSLVKDFAPNSKRAYLGRIKSFGTFLQKRFDLNTNPAQSIHPGPVQALNHEEGVATVAQLLEVATEPERWLIVLMWYGGMNMREALQLRHSDIVFPSSAPSKPSTGLGDGNAPRRKQFRRKVSSKPLIIHLNADRTVRINNEGKAYLKDTSMYNEIQSNKENSERFLFRRRKGATHVALSERTGQCWIEELCKKIGKRILPCNISKLNT